MGNRLNIDLMGKIVVVSKKYYKGDERARRFLCQCGFGCNPETMGNAIGGKFLIDGEKCRVEGWQIEKLSDDQSTEVDGIKPTETDDDTTLTKKLEYLKACVDNRSHEDVAGHLCDLLEWCRINIKPSVGKPFKTLTAMVKYYGQNPQVPQED